MFSLIADGIKGAEVVIVCVSDEYAASENCMREFRFACCSLKKPIIKVIVGTDGTSNKWMSSEIVVLSGDDYINCQTKNKGTSWVIPKLLI
jgi:hypothetical protein